MTDPVTPNQTEESAEATPAFDDFNLLPEITESIKKMGFETPTPVQVRTYEKAMKGEDLIAMAQTGTGKTAAFGIPMVQKLDPDKKAIQGLVLTPTRELALQVCKELGKIGEARGMKSVPVYGGASFTKQVTEVKDGASIVVGTPGRVLDHIRRRTINFGKLEALVLDEADEMLSMGFEKEISEIIESLPKKRQTLLFSATIPEDIRRLTKRYMGEAEIISVSGDAIAAKDVAHFVYLVSGEMRQQYMVKVIEEERPDSALVFCNTKEQTQSLAGYLKKQGYNSEWLNSDLSQNERERVMRLTRNGKVQYLVATDVAARGIDVSHLSHVINYSFPESLEVYVHRTGRTGRAGRQGTAISLISPQDIGNLYMLRLTYKIFPVEKTLTDDDTAKKALELNRMEEMRKSLGAVDDEYLSLARRLLQDVRAEKIIAGMLARRFSGVETESSRVVVSSAPAESAVQPPAVDVDKTPKQEKTKGTTGKQNAKPKRQSPAKAGDGKKTERTMDAPTRKMRAVEKPKAASATAKVKGDEGTSAADKATGAKKKPGSAKEASSGTAAAKNDEIYVDMGRKDGLKISSLMKEIMQRTGLPRTALGKVRMLTRSTFITVSKEYFDAVMKAVSSIEVNGKKLKSAPAEPR